jgi:hypothetical protein
MGQYFALWRKEGMGINLRSYVGAPQFSAPDRFVGKREVVPALDMGVLAGERREPFLIVRGLNIGPKRFRAAFMERVVYKISALTTSPSALSWSSCPSR